MFNSDVKICPNNAKIWYNLAKKAAIEGDFKKTIKLYETSIDLYPNYTSALNNLANIYQLRKNNFMAKNLLIRAITIDPTFSTAWMNLAIVEKAIDNLEQSEKYFLNALRLR